MADEHEPTALAERAPSALHPMVAQVLLQNPTPEALGALMAMQERWEDRRAEQAYTRALVALRRDLPPWLERDVLVDWTSKEGKRTKYRHTSLAAGMETVFPHLITHGFAVQWIPARKGTDVEITCILRHEDGHSEKAALHAPPDTSGSKSPSQAVASTATLLERYTLFALLGLATKDQTEPGDHAPEIDPAAVDTAANRKLALEIVRAGRKREDAERQVQRSVQDWTGADLVAIRAWLSPEPAPPPTTGQPETGAEDGPRVPYGRNKGTPISALSDTQLDWYIQRAEEKQESAWLDQLTEESERRAMRGADPT